MALDHHAENSLIATGDLSRDILRHRDLILGLLLTVAMTCVDHQTASHVDCG